MISPKRVIQFKLFAFILSIIVTVGVISIFYLIFAILSYLGCCFPQISIDRFFDLGFFSLSTLGFIIFLTITPFQTVQRNLSPGFYARMIRNKWSHFSLYMLLNCFIFSFLAIAFYQEIFKNEYSGLFYMALTATNITAIWIHRTWALRYLHEPYIVYANIDKLIEEEPYEGVWLDMLECTYKSVKEGRLGDSKNFIKLLRKLYDLTSATEEKNILHEDLKSLYKTTESFRPISRYMEVTWPSLFYSH